MQKSVKGVKKSKKPQNVPRLSQQAVQLTSIFYRHNPLSRQCLLHQLAVHPFCLTRVRNSLIPQWFPISHWKQQWRSTAAGKSHKWYFVVCSPRSRKPDTGQYSSTSGLACSVLKGRWVLWPQHTCVHTDTVTVNSRKCNTQDKYKIRVYTTNAANPASNLAQSSLDLWEVERVSYWIKQ